MASETGGPARRLGILLATAPGHPNTATVVGLARAARERGDEVSLYLIDEGVRHLLGEEVPVLGARLGVRLYACAYGCERRDVPRSDRALFAGLYVLYSIVQGSDRFLAFT